MRTWEEFLKKQEELLGADVVSQWLRPLEVVHFDSGNLYLEAKDSFQVLWFEEHIRPLLKRHLLNNNFRPIKVHISVADASSQKPKKEKPKSPPPIQFTFDPLDASMTLDHFILGEDNAVVARLLKELGEEKSKLGVFNPIYLWGSEGCGKTHLLVALTKIFQSKGLKAIYARAETFTEHVVSAIRSSEMQSFRKAYRNVDVLLIDDVHVFARKDATQEEFFHTFNTLHTSGKQMILTSKCASAQLQQIEPRLVSRFEWGINIHFKKLKQSELKLMILKRCDALNFPLADEVINFLAEIFASSKSINRAMDALVLRSHLQEDARHKRNTQSIDRKMAEKMLADLIAQEQKNALSPERIIATVSSIYGVRSEDLLGKSQSQDCSIPRQIAMYLCRRELKLPFQGIGQIFGRDHSTVMTSIKHVEKKIESHDAELQSLLNEIQQILCI
jgi:chromosomal replication initiator protein